MTMCSTKCTYLLRCQPTFSKTLMVSVDASKLGYTELFFVEPGVSRWSLLLRGITEKQQTLLVKGWIAGSIYMFQQDSTPAHCVQLLQRDRRQVTQFISFDLWQPTSLTWTRLISAFGVCSKIPVRDTADLKQLLIETWLNIPQTFADKAIDEWRLRLRAWVKGKGRRSFQFVVNVVYIINPPPLQLFLSTQNMLYSSIANSASFICDVAYVSTISMIS